MSVTNREANYIWHEHVCADKVFRTASFQLTRGQVKVIEGILTNVLKNNIGYILLIKARHESALYRLSAGTDCMEDCKLMTATAF